MKPVTLRTTIEAAKAEAQARGTTVLEVLGEDAERLVVYLLDLERMIGMGLGELPLDAIAVPLPKAVGEQEPGVGSVCGPLEDRRKPKLRATLEVSRHLSDYLPVRFVAALYELQSIFRKADLRGYVIGGIPRDLLLLEDRKLEIQDVDVTIEGDAVQFAWFLQENSRNFEVREEYPEFGTAKVFYKGITEFDLASSRKEVYRHCGALPEVVARGVPLSDDIVRRDFTANALAMAIHDLGQVLDYSNGIKDLADQKIRALHSASFFEDPSRILRAMKFGARLGFDMTPGTERLMRKFIEYASMAGYKGGGHRIQAALKALCLLPESENKVAWLELFVANEGFRLFCDCGPLSIEQRGRLLYRLPMVSERLAALREEAGTWLGLLGYPIEHLVWEVYLCLLLRELPSDTRSLTLQRLELTRQEREAIEQYARLGEGNPLTDLSDEVSPVTIVEALEPIALPVLMTFALTSDDWRGSLNMVRLFRSRLQNIKPELNGKDLISLGLPEGAPIGEALKRLREARLRGEVASRLDEVQFIQRTFRLS